MYNMYLMRYKFITTILLWMQLDYKYNMIVHWRLILNTFQLREFPEALATLKAAVAAMEKANMDKKKRERFLKDIEQSKVKIKEEEAKEDEIDGVEVGQGLVSESLSFRLLLSFQFSFHLFLKFVTHFIPNLFSHIVSQFLPYAVYHYLSLSSNLPQFLVSIIFLFYLPDFSPWLHVVHLPLLWRCSRQAGSSSGSRSWVSRLQGEDSQQLILLSAWGTRRAAAGIVSNRKIPGIVGYRK